MKVIVTGGAGFVGTNLVSRLLKEGYEVISLDNYSTGKKENEQEGCTYVEVDVSNSSKLKAKLHWALNKEKPDMIFHLAALARIQPSLTNPSKALENNFLSTVNILEYGRENNIPIVYAGSSSKHHAPYGSPYAWSKWGGEQLCELYSTCFQLPTAVCRFYNVYGPYQLEEGEYSTVVGIFEKQYRNNEPLTITDKGEQRRDFTHVEDIVSGLVKCGRSLVIPNEYHAKVSGEIFELGSGVNFSINELATLFGEDYPTKYIPAREGEYPVTLCDYSKASKMLGYKPVKSMELYVKEFLSNHGK